ncbi:hypothetical protein [Streptomyces luteireticuli]|uniref:hypothetical protein n=1 Tax=Streptomyces luteireticuli TaxID=173858 RepID=UPI003558CA13
MSSALSAIPAVLFVALGYAALCAVSPFGNCRKCRGFGFKVKKNRHGRITRGRYCRRCDGHGKRIRVGRHLYNAAVRVHRDGTR